MTDHLLPIAPPPELVDEWLEQCLTSRQLVIHAARWGADQELEACVKLLSDLGGDGEMIRRVRRPKPPSLNEVALQMLGTIERDAHYLPEITDTIRRALEQLPDDHG